VDETAGWVVASEVVEVIEEVLSRIYSELEFSTFLSKHKLITYKFPRHYILAPNNPGIYSSCSLPPRQ
jgi:hypothetical protein